MQELINFIPGRCKDVAFPHRIICKNEKEFYEAINKYNGAKERIYFSIYDCNEYRNFGMANVHVIAFDLDSDNCLENLKKMWHYCKEKNYKSLFLFSTKGFWCYIFTKNYQLLKNRKAALGYAGKHIAKEVGLTIGDPKTCDLDFHIIGEIKRIARLPNGYDVGRKRYCIPITIEDLEKGYGWICEKSKKQCFDFTYYNDGLFDISKFDKPEEQKVDIEYLQTEIEVDNDMINSFLPCVKNCIANTPLKSHNMFWVWTTIYMKEMGFGVNAIKKMIKPFLEKHPRSDHRGKDDFDHYINYDHLPESIFDTEYFFPKCDVLIEAGYCPGKCKKYKSDGSPIYI